MSTGFTSNMVLTCLYFHYTFVCGLKNQSGTAAVEAVDKVCDMVDTMHRLRSDGGCHFTCKAFKTMCERQGIQHMVVNRYSPFQNGIAKRAVAGLKKTFRLFPDVVKQEGKGSQWFSLLAGATRRLNDRPFLGHVPFEVFYGRPREEQLRYADTDKIEAPPSLQDLQHDRAAANEDFDLH
ncbi:hypothetical protein FOL47_001069 [Perkinsus chesapeaki]|uniref:Integrase catalytic domain-containing protein n=1 Tax=Perkinsus chesapeaki TaxID=330153 RepID=A0A7J6KT91_PERCH|nr:hypothetical protein FOL47_001069 [Perkinsus chesapeaki]